MLTLIKSSFIDYKLTILRNKKTPNSLFRQTMNEISYLIASEVLKHIKFKKIKIDAYKPGKSGINKNRKYIKLSANESSLGISPNVIKLFNNKIFI